MTRTLKDILKEMKALEAEMVKVRRIERQGVIARIKEAIATYDLQVQDLFGEPQKIVKSRKKSSIAVTKTSRTVPRKKPLSIPKYADGHGRTWTGVGKRPNWFREAIAAGKTAEDLLVTK